MTDLGPARHTHLSNYMAAITAERSVVMIQAPAGRLAFDEVYDEHFGFIWRVLRGIGVPFTHLEDVSQEVWLVVHRRLDDFEGRSALRSWLFGIAYRVYLGYRRKARLDRELPRPETELSQHASHPAGGPHAQAETAEAARFLALFLSRLSQAKRDVFYLCAVEGWSVPEVAHTLQIPLNTAYSRLRLVRAEFERAANGYRGKRT